VFRDHFFLKDTFILGLFYSNVTDFSVAFTPKGYLHNINVFRIFRNTFLVGYFCFPTPLAMVSLQIAYRCSKNKVISDMWPEGAQSVREVTKRPLTAGTLFKTSMIQLVEKLQSKVR